MSFGVLKLSDFGWSTYSPTLYYDNNLEKDRLFAVLWTMSLLKLLMDSIMTKKSISGV